MPYTSPLEDTKFVLENLLPAHDDLDETTIDASIVGLIPISLAVKAKNK